jgi:hypothetical protein
MFSFHTGVPIGTGYADVGTEVWRRWQIRIFAAKAAPTCANSDTGVTKGTDDADVCRKYPLPVPDRNIRGCQ